MLRYLMFFLALCVLGLFVAVGAAVWVFYSYGRDIPDYRQLATYDPPVMTRIYAGNGALIEEYATEGRVFVPISGIPDFVAHAFVAAEDQRFYSHPGVDPIGVARAVLTNVKNMGSGRRMVGASSITQQVAKNFLLTSEMSMERKIKEAILALRIEQAFSKDHILELYLNEIYLGMGSYGVAAAAMNYFNKPLDELTVGEAAYLAGLPKAPNNYHPLRNPEAARARRDYVLRRMKEDGYISAAQEEAARSDPLRLHRRDELEFVDGGKFLAEDVRRELSGTYGDEALYQGGLAVRTSLDPHLQNLADRALKEGLIAYDRRHGWRGPIARLNKALDFGPQLDRVARPAGMPELWRLAAVENVDDAGADLRLRGGYGGRIDLAEMKWARPWLEGQRVGDAVTSAHDVLKKGDVVAVQPIETEQAGRYGLRQIPDVEGAIVALDPHTGRILAMTGGFSYDRSQFNRATQAERQPGSAFKPFVYLAALDNGFTPSSMILDAPFVLDQGEGQGKWKPQNYSGRFYGPTTLRQGIEKSRNLMTVRLAQSVGIGTISDYARRFGIRDSAGRHLSYALGSGETTLLKLTAAYAMLANGGKRVVPTLIDRVQDRRGKTIYRHDARDCPDCQVADWHNQPPPDLPDTRAQVADPQSVYQIISILEGVVQRGTGRSIRSIGKPLAGKTGTSNDSFDTWFVGFSPNLAAGVFVGFDDPRTLGPKEAGSSVAAPIFKQFMEGALKDAPATPFRVPEGIRLVRVVHDTGLLARPGDRGVIIEAFKPGTEPGSEGVVLGGTDVPGMLPGTSGGGADQPQEGGLY